MSETPQIRDWMRKAAHMGVITDELFLISLYDCGVAFARECSRPVTGVTKRFQRTSVMNYHDAIYWIRKILHQRSFYTGGTGDLLKKERASKSNAYWQDNENLTRYEYGTHYYHGNGVQQNSMKALHWLKIAARDSKENGDKHYYHMARKEIHSIKHGNI